jgi:hypothetical protein
LLESTPSALFPWPLLLLPPAFDPLPPFEAGAEAPPPESGAESLGDGEEGAGAAAGAGAEASPLESGAESLGDGEEGAAGDSGAGDGSGAADDSGAGDGAGAAAGAGAGEAAGAAAGLAAGAPAEPEPALSPGRATFVVSLRMSSDTMMNCRLLALDSAKAVDDTATPAVAVINMANPDVSLRELPVR